MRLIISDVQTIMSPSISIRSGIEINPVTSINDLLSGTSFQEDEVAQEHLQSLGAAFHEISKTAEGQVLLVSMEGLAHRIKVYNLMKSQ